MMTSRGEDSPAVEESAVRGSAVHGYDTRLKSREGQFSELPMSSCQDDGGHERVTQLANSRTGYAAVVTRKHNEFQRLVQDRENDAQITVSVMHNKLLDLRAAFNKFEDVHLQYSALVSKVGSGQALAGLPASEEQYRSVMTVVGKAQRQVEDIEEEVQSRDVGPSDSVSQRGSVISSTTSSAKARAAARKAALEAKAAFLRQRHALEMEQMQVEQRENRRKREVEMQLAELELTGEIEAAAAEEQTLAKFIDGPRQSVVSTRPVQQSDLSQALNRQSDEVEQMASGSPGIERVECQSSPGVSTCYKTAVGSQRGVSPGSERRSRKSTLNPTAAEWSAASGRQVRIQGGEEPRRLYASAPTGNVEQGNGSRSGNPSSVSHWESQLAMQRQMLDTMRLPRSSLMIFDGDPTNFWLFMSAFDSCVDNSSVSDAEKLNMLFEYCNGKVLRVIKPCAFMRPSEGYIKARRLLQERFGNDYEIAEAWVHKVTDGPQIRPGNREALQDFADDVRCCLETLRAMDMMNQVDTRGRMVEMLKRLPTFLQGRYRNEAVKVRKETGRYPNIEHFANFIQTASDEANDPVFGSLMDKPGESKDKERPKKKGSSFGVKAMGNEDAIQEPSKAKSVGQGAVATGTSGSGALKCYVCQGHHQLRDCDKFSREPVQKRLEIVKLNKLCFNCLNASNHMARRCMKDSDCAIDGCRRKHSRLLHHALQSADQGLPQASRPYEGVPKGNEPRVEAKSCACGPLKTDTSKVTLPVVAVNVRGVGQGRFIRTHALLDSGSNRTFCSQTLVHQLGLKGEKTSLSLMTINEGRSAEAMEVSLEVTGTTGKWKTRRVIHAPKVYALESFPSFQGCVAVAADVKQWDHLGDVTVPRTAPSGITLLIGQDIPQALMPLEVRHGSKGQPYAVRTALGWTVNGPIGEQSTGIATCNFIHADSRQEVTLEAQVDQFWKLDIGQELAGGLPQMSPDDEKVIQIWEQSLKVQDGHYEMAIPFKSDPPELPDNRNIAERRLLSLGRRLSKDPALLEKYGTGMADLIRKGYAERVPSEEIEGAEGRKWYLPHHNVTNPNKPDKTRIVFDCAAVYEGTSLNRKVLQGPDMTNRLMGVLLRFRVNRVAVMGDIETMFYQVRVSPQHRDALRFLWWTDGDPGGSPEVYRMTAHPFGGVWSPSCASFALRRTAQDHRREYCPEVVETVLENFYADDCLKALETEEEAINLVQDLCELLSKGGFHLTKWISNSKKVMQAIPQEERAKEVRSLDLERTSLPVERALGVQWDTDADMLGIRIQNKERSPTRRGLLSVVSSVYDPLGLVSPFVLGAKKIFQAECRMKKGWDDHLEEQNKQRWFKWLEGLQKLEEFKLERCLVPPNFGRVVEARLHHFCDASMDAYGTASYLRLVSANGRSHCALVLGKSRLAPIKHMTVPRLELSAAVMAVRVDSMLRRELKIENRSTFWSDSMIVLHYIRNRSKRFHTFVANRVSIIHDGSTPDQWRHVDTRSNPADDASRGLDAEQMVSSLRWKQGPEFLGKDMAKWPTMPDGSPDQLENDVEVKQEAKACAADACVTHGCFDRLLQRYSCWYRLKRAVAWLIRFKTWLLDRGANDHLMGNLQVQELQEAERRIVLYVQRKHYAKELQSCDKDGVVSNRSLIYNLEPYKDSDGALRVRGRLQAAAIPEDCKHQLILPRDHHVAELIVRHVHEREAKHSGREYVMSLVRRRFWIPRARPLVNRVLRQCGVCRRLRAVPGSQRMASLPPDRVTPGRPPFTHVGVDCFGPFRVKRGRSQEKRYGCLFTCMAIRAVHIEVLHSLDADSFLNALIRFMCRRGVPETVRSDNGTNFIGGEKMLKESIKKWNKGHQCERHLLLNEIRWEFNPPAASHMGGVWERQIRSVRKVLNVVLKDQVLTDECLATFFCEAESVINGRPLTPVPDSPNDLEALTPNHLLLLRPGRVAPQGVFTREGAYGRRWRHTQFLADRFWDRWVKEYLPSLQLRQKWIDPKRNFREGDVILVMHENVPRNCWPLGRVTRVFPGKDGLVRSAEVRTRSSVLTRPVSKLCLLEPDATSISQAVKVACVGGRRQ